MAEDHTMPSLGQGLPTSLSPEMLAKILRYQEGPWREIQSHLLREFQSQWRPLRPADNSFYEKLHFFLCDSRNRYKFNRIAVRCGKKNKEQSLPERICAYYLKSHRTEPTLREHLPKEPTHMGLLDALAKNDDADRLANVAWAFFEQGKIDIDSMYELLECYPELQDRLEDVLPDNTSDEGEIDVHWARGIERLRQIVEEQSLSRPDVVLARRIRFRASRLVEVAVTAAESKKKEFWRKTFTLLESHKEIYSVNPQLAEMKSVLEDESKRGAVPDDAQSVLTDIEKLLMLFSSEQENVANLSKNIPSVSFEERSELQKKIDLASKAQQNAVDCLEGVLRSFVGPGIRDDLDRRPERENESDDTVETTNEKDAPTYLKESSEETPLPDVTSNRHDDVDAPEQEDAQQEKREASQLRSPTETAVTEHTDAPSDEEKGTEADPVPQPEYQIQNDEKAHPPEGKSDDETGSERRFESVGMQPSDDWLSRLFYSLLRKGRIAWAYWLAYASDGLMDPNILGALYEGGRVRPDAPCNKWLLHFLDELQTKETSLNEDERVLLSSAILQPLLFSQPFPPALYQLVISAAVEDTPLTQLVHHLRDKCLYQGVTLGRQILGEDPQKGDIETRLRELSVNADDFLKRIPHIGFNYKPAEKALQFLYGPGNDFHRLHTLIAEDQRQRIAEIKALQKRLDPRQIVSDLHQQFELPEIKRPLTGGARNKLVRHLHSSMVLTSEWVDLIEKLRSKNISEQGEGADSLRLDLEKRLLATRQTLKAAKQTPATSWAELQIAELEGRLAGKHQQVPRIDKVCIEFPGICLDDDMIPLDDELPSLPNAIDRLLNQNVNIRDVFDECLERNEFVRAELLIERSPDLGKEDTERLNKQRDRKRRELEKKFDELQMKVEDAFLLGQLNAIVHPVTEDQLNPLTRSALLSLINEGMCKLKTGGTELSVNVRKVANDVRQAEDSVLKLVEDRNFRLDRQRETLITSFIKSFPNNDEAVEDRNYFERAFEDCMREGDHVAAFDLLDRGQRAIREGERIARATVGSSESLKRFLDQASVYREYLDQPSDQRQLPERIHRGETVCSIPFAKIDSDRRKESINTLRIWGELSNCRLEHAADRATESVARICRYVGFSANEASVLSEPTQEGLAHFRVTLDSSPSSPLPAFGSMLSLYLNVVVSQLRKEPRQITEFLKQQRIQHKPTLVLLMYPESPHYRLKWQRESATNHLMALPLDLCVLMHLCGIRNRLPVLLDILLPFTWAQPYITKGETVAREMFVGRQREVESVFNSTGGSIVFGGRQLGKSALLTHVRREYHDPQRGIFVEYLDVNDLGMDPQTHAEMVGAFWRRVSDQLMKEGAIPKLDKSVIKIIKSSHSSEKIGIAIFEAIVQSLEAEDAKRIILLLDETDTLLDRDSSFDFKLIRRLRGLMAQTGRRFKVVFAGLQSVQRYKNWRNHPFAQLGAEMVINPLPPVAAQELIIRPFRSLGFSFENTNLVLRILSLSNYHPGLIQIFGNRLLEHLYTKPQREEMDTPFRSVSSDDILKVERDESFREDIRNRFDWTLDLDDCYKVLTYALVLTADPSRLRRESEFMELGKDWWPPVFENMDPQGLRALLEEMVGLGVLLREQEDLITRYRLRSPNLLRLLGPQQTIEEELERIISLDRPSRPNPRNFHSIITKPEEKPKQFGVLSKEQESQLLEMPHPFMLSLVLGSPAMGLRQVHDHVRKLMQDLAGTEGVRVGDHDWQERKIKIDNGVLMAADREVLKFRDVFKPRDRKHCYVLVDLEGVAFQQDIGIFFEQILKDVGRLCTTKSRGKIVTLLAPQQIWDWICSDAHRRLQSEPRITSMIIRPWSDGAISNALDNIGLRTHSKRVGTEIFNLTAGIHTLVSETLAKANTLRGTDATKARDVAEKVKRKFLDSATEDRLADLGIIPDDGSALQKVTEMLLSFSEEQNGSTCLNETSFQNAIEMLPPEDDAHRLLEERRSDIIEWFRALNLIRTGPESVSTGTKLKLCPWTAELFSKTY